MWYILSIAVILMSVTRGIHKHYPEIKPDDWVGLNRELRMIVDQLGIYRTMKDSTEFPRRSKLRFLGRDVSVADDETNDRTNVTIGAGGTTELFEWDDFISGSMVDSPAGASQGIGKLGWVAYQGAGGNGVVTYDSGSGGAAPAAEEQHPGIILLGTGTVASGLLDLFLCRHTAACFRVDADYTVRFWLANRLTFSVVAQSAMRVGLTMSASSSDPPDEGAYFERLQSETTYFAVCRRDLGGGEQTRVNTGVAADDTAWHDFRITRLSDGTMSFQLDDARVAISTNVPQGGAAGRGINPFVQVKTFNTTNRVLLLDRFELTIRGLTR